MIFPSFGLPQKEEVTFEFEVSGSLERLEQLAARRECNGWVCLGPPYEFKTCDREGRVGVRYMQSFAWWKSSEDRASRSPYASPVLVLQAT